MLHSFGEIANAFHQRERQRDAEIAFSKMSPVTVEDVQNAANAAAEKVNAKVETVAEKVNAKVEATAEKVNAHTTAETAAATAGRAGSGGAERSRRPTAVAAQKIYPNGMAVVFMSISVPWQSH